MLELVTEHSKAEMLETVACLSHLAKSRLVETPAAMTARLSDISTCSIQWNLVPLNGTASQKWKVVPYMAVESMALRQPATAVPICILSIARPHLNI